MKNQNLGNHRISMHFFNHQLTKRVTVLVAILNIIAYINVCFVVFGVAVFIRPLSFFHCVEGRDLICSTPECEKTDLYFLFVIVFDGSTGTSSVDANYW